MSFVLVKQFYFVWLGSPSTVVVLEFLYVVCVYMLDEGLVGGVLGIGVVTNGSNLYDILRSYMVS